MAVTQTRDLELLAPARNTDIGIAAISCGADAVYIAGPQFGARQAAGNSIGDIRKLCDLAHQFGARIFITLNTILYDDELDLALEQLDEVQAAGADAVIVQDLAILKLVEKSRRTGRGFSLPLHASTQCAIRTPDQAKFYEDLGFSRLILERELSLEQIHDIRNAVQCELECFVHGALCVCYSGQCYMSEAITGRSANRGACAQACRSLYDLADSSGKVIIRNKALLSLKDLNLKDRLSGLVQAGVTSFKIEGRLKNISYVKNIVRDYSLALDKIISVPGSGLARASYGVLSGGFTPDPDKTFNRGYTRLYIDGERGRWSTFDSAKGMGEEIGTVEYISPGKDRIRIRPSTRRSAPETGIVLHNGDGFSFVARNSEVIGFRADKCTGMEIQCRSVPEIFRGALLFRNSDTAFEKEIETGTPVREIPVSLDILTTEENGRFSASVTAESADGRRISRKFDAGKQTAENSERMKALIMNQLSKSTGHYRFTARSLRMAGDKVPFLPVSAVNSIRRDIARELQDIPCIPRPLLNRTDEIPGPHRADITSDVSYKYNVSNSLSREIYLESGAATVEDAFEISHRQGAELMRTKYCIRYETGLCPKQTGTASRQDMYLMNNGRRFILHFDCRKCEMSVLQDIPLSRK